MTPKVPAPAQPAVEASKGAGRPTPQQDVSAGPHRWLLFVHQLPAKPSNLRVRTWRRLQQLGAVPVKQAVYVLPDSAGAREDFEWLKTEIESAGGQASMFSANTVDRWSSDDLVNEFRRARETDYAALARAIEHALRASQRKHAPRPSRRSAAKITETFRQRLSAIEAIDFFGSAGRDHVALRISELHHTLSRAKKEESGAPSDSRSEQYVARTWVTRPRPGIDRISSAWLIKRFIDGKARFDFVDQPPRSGKAIPFDMFGVEFSHHGESCTFETLTRTFAISHPAVDRLAGIVHDLDLKDGRFGAPEAVAVGTIIDGLQALYADDHVLLEHGMTVFEALYRAFERAARSPRPRPVATQRGRRRQARQRS